MAIHRLSITYKLTRLLALLSTAPLVLVVYSGTSEEVVSITQSRFAACEQLALGCSLQFEHQDYRAIEEMLDQFMQRTDQLQAVRLIRFDGLVIHQLGVSDEFTEAIPANSTAKHLQIPIFRSGRIWGYLAAIYDSDPATHQLWQMIQAILATVSLNLLTFGMLLRRSLAVLDSAGAVPKRVRNTLDTIVGGVVILDANRKIVMANEAFQNSCKRNMEDLLGSSLGDIPFRHSGGLLPWDQAMDERERQSGATLFLEDGQLERCFVVNATPVFDSKDRVAGTLVSFEDVTNLEQQKQSLLVALNELETSKDQIHQQNLKLQELASRDMLTGAYNRRSLYEQLETLWQAYLQVGQPLSCVMFDVDHFKKLNDTYGHAVGDQVLKDVARTIQENVQLPAVAARYGGEEFCVVLPGMSVAEATQIAEQLRHAIETNLAAPYRVTASLGVSGTEFGAASFQAIIEQADQGLYAAKHGGRNAVRCWSPELTVDAVAPTPTSPTNNDQLISYHAVASLHAALAYRDADTALHSQRVAEMAVHLGRGLMTTSELYILEIAAVLHDVGKIGVPDAILLKPDKLTAEEWRVMETHARIGVEIVESSFNSKMLADIVRYHHYRFDGGGTPPGGPVGEEIPLGARIICIVDAFDAMVSNRVYRKGRPPEQAFVELRRCAGSQFDPVLVERFVAGQVGWRIDSRFLHAEAEAKEALTIGHLTERTINAFETQDAKGLAEALDRMATACKQYNLPAIRDLAQELKQAIGDARSDDWSFATTMLQDLLEMCLMVQRAHIRDVASRPQIVEDCPQRESYRVARSWWSNDES